MEMGMITKQEIMEQLRHLKDAAGKDVGAMFENTGESDKMAGAITVSGVVVHLPEREVFLVNNDVQSEWSFPAGELLPEDESFAGAVLRVLTEEYGLDEEELIPVNVTDGIQYCVGVTSCRNTGKGEAGHYDFRFLFGYMGDKRVGGGCEETEYKWVSAEEPFIREMTGLDSVDRILLEGLEKYEQEIREEQGNDYLVTPLAAYLFRLGNLYAGRNDLDLAEEMFRRSVEAYKNSYDDEYEVPPGIISAIWNLSLIYKEKGCSDLEKTSIEEGLAISEEFLKQDSNFLSDMVLFQNALGDIYRRMGYIEEAENIYVKALAALYKGRGMEELYWKELFAVAGINNVLGDLYRDEVKKLEKAEACYLEVVKGYRRIGELYGMSQYAESLNAAILKLIDFYESAGELKKAESWRKELADNRE